MRSGASIYQLFRTSNHDFFMFDTYKNAIQQISKNCYQHLDLLRKSETDFYEEAEKIQDQDFAAFYQRSVEQGFFTKFAIETLEHPMTAILDDILDTNIESLNIQVTQNCNLRCEYCPYTGNYYSNRTHVNRNMSFELAKKGIDFLYMHSRDCEKINLSFYGGEPLLEFKLLKQCMEYSKQLFQSKKIVFSLTTNGTLLTDEMMDCFIANDVYLTISLDGPANVQDKHRVFANGKGSFSVIYHNLAVFAEKYPEYYQDKVMFNSVCDQDESLKECDRFFSSDPLVDKNEISTTFHSKNYLINEPVEDAMKDEFIEHYEHEKYKCFLFKMKRITKNTSRMQLNVFEEIKNVAKQLNAFSGIPKTFHPSGPCVPGRKKLFMDVNGTFYPCERINETSPCSIIGTIDTGIMIDKCGELLNIGKITRDQCANCWAIAHCKFCFIQADDGEKLCPESRIKNCDELYISLTDKLKDICVLEKNGCYLN